MRQIRKPQAIFVTWGFQNKIWHRPIYPDAVGTLLYVEFVNEVNKRDPAALSGTVTIEDYVNKKPVSTYRQNGF